MSNKTKEQAKQHLEDNNLDNVQINSMKDTPYYVSDAMADFALSLSPVSELDDRWNLVQEFKESAEFKRLTLELGIDRESAIIAAGKFIDWYRNTHAQKPQLTEAKVVEILDTIILKAEHAKGFNYKTPSIYEQIAMLARDAKELTAPKRED